MDMGELAREGTRRGECLDKSEGEAMDALVSNLE